MPETPSEAALNFAIDAWGERTSKDPDPPKDGPGWTFGWYCEGILKDRGFMVARISDLEALVFPAPPEDVEAASIRISARLTGKEGVTIER